MNRTASPDQATQDRHQTSRILSDAELIYGGAEYTNGVLQVTPEQATTIKHRYSRAMGKSGLELTGATLHTDSRAELAMLENDHEAYNVLRLSTQLGEITAEYEDILWPYFAKAKGGLGYDPFYEHDTTEAYGDRQADIHMSFSAKKSKWNRRKYNKPESVKIGIDRYSKGDKLYPRDSVACIYNEEGKIAKIDLKTDTMWHTDAQWQIHDKARGPHNEGVAADICKIVDPGSVADTLPIVNNGHLAAISGYEATLSLQEGEYSLKLTRNVAEYFTNVEKTYFTSKGSSKEIVYRFDPSTNNFKKVDDQSTWEIGPDELDVGTFIHAAKRALSNIPTIPA